MRIDSNWRCSRAIRLRAVVLLAALAVSMPGWALPWPWHHRPHARPVRAAPPAVHAIAVTAEGTGAESHGLGAAAAQPASAAGPGIAQSWDQNTLLLDLTREGGQGGATLTRLPGAGWPIRLEFRVRPGAFARLVVQGAERVIFAVPAHGPPLILRLDPGVYVTDTPSITLRWSAAGG
jgi:hypothetical protein